MNNPTKDSFFMHKFTYLDNDTQPFPIHDSCHLPVQNATVIQIYFPVRSLRRSTVFKTCSLASEQVFQTVNP